MVSTLTPVFYKNLSLYTEDYHSHLNQALVFVHGRWQSTNGWEGQLNSDVFASYRLIAFDLPGHGRSDRSPNSISDYTLDGLVKALEAVIATLRLNNFVLVGCSLGGHIALEAISRLRGCRGIFAMTMPLTKPVHFDLMYEQGELMSQVLTETPSDSAVEAFLPLLLRSGANVPAFLREDFYRTDTRVHAAITQSIIEDEFQDETTIVRRNKVPIALVLGQYDQIHRLSYLETLGLSPWSGRPILIPDAGHLAAFENPTAVNAVLHSFADECFRLG